MPVVVQIGEPVSVGPLYESVPALPQGDHHLVKRVGKAAQLVTRIDRHDYLQVTFPNSVGSVDQLPQRPRYCARYGYRSQEADEKGHGEGSQQAVLRFPNGTVD